MRTSILRLAAAGAISMVIGPPAATAGEDASPWHGDKRSAVRLIAGSQPADATIFRAGIEVRLARGWHTYWRHPGDAGVPPRFDFHASANVKAVEVLWPAPQRIPEQGLTVIGYDSDVILPLRITPRHRGKPVTLRLKLDYAVCEKLCVPADGKVELVIAGGISTREGALAAAEARVPKKVALGAGSVLAIRTVQRLNGSSPPQIVVDVTGPAGIDLFIEGPTAEWALPVPVLMSGAAGGLHRFAVAQEGAPPGARFQGAQLILTAVAGGEAIEVAARLE